MKLECPRCGNSIQDSSGGVLTKCRKCGLDGDLAQKMNYDFFG